jgi:Transposase DDE domain group 1
LHPAGESDDGSLRVDSDPRLKLEFQGSRITSDAGLLAYRELEDVLGLTDLAAAELSECRRGKNIRHLLTGLFRLSVFGRLAHDPAMRAVVDRGGLDCQDPSTKAPFVGAVLAGLLWGGVTSGARAQQSISSEQQTANPSGWSFNVAPYLWMPTIDTTLKFNLPAAVGGTLTTDSSIGFGDLLSHLNFATMIAADAKYDRFSLLTDFIYMNLGGTSSHAKSFNFPGLPSVPISGAVQTSAGMDLNSTIWTLAGGYTLLQGDWGNFDVIAGLRYLELNTRIDYGLGLTLTGPGGNGASAGRIGSVSGSGNIWNGIGGFRGRVRITNTGLFIPYYFDAGAGASKFTWQIASGLGYQTGWADVSLTYRYLSFEQNSSAVLQHMQIGGPMIMVNFSF